MLYLVSDDGLTFADHPSHRTRKRPRHPVQAFDSIASSSISLLPADAVPTEYAAEPNKLVTPVTHGTLIPSPLPQPAPLTWESYLLSLPAWEQFLLSAITIPDRPLLFHCLRTAAQLYLASDGSAANCKGSLAWFGPRY
jgi:hypothetical protein